MKQKAVLKPKRVSRSIDLPAVDEINESLKRMGNSKSYLHAIIDSLEDELLVVDKNYRIVQANEAVLRKHGKRRQEVIGSYCYEVSHNLARRCNLPLHECPIRTVWKTGKSAQATHVHVFHVEGERRERYLDIIASPVTDSRGNVIAVTELMRDVTDRKEAEEQLESSREQLRSLSAHLESVREEERKKIAHDLHDETSQVIASLTALLEAAVSKLPSSANQSRVLLNKAQELSIQILDQIHKLIYQLRPTIIDDLGLAAAIRWLAESNLEVAGIKANLKVIGQEIRLTSELETALFRVIQEAISNIVRHAHAKSVNIRLYFKKRAIRLRVRDDGCGFDVNEAITSKDRPRGLGLLGMKERIELINGTVNISSCPGGGTEIDIEIPFNCEVANEQD